MKIETSVQGVRVRVEIDATDADGVAAAAVCAAIANTLAALERCAPAEFVVQEIESEEYATADGSFGASFGEDFVVQQEGTLSKEAHDAHIAVCERLSALLPPGVLTAMVRYTRRQPLTERMQGLLVQEGYARIGADRSLVLTDPGEVAYARAREECGDGPLHKICWGWQITETSAQRLNQRGWLTAHESQASDPVVEARIVSGSDVSKGYLTVAGLRAIMRLDGGHTWKARESSRKRWRALEAAASPEELEAIVAYRSEGLILA